MTYNGPKITIKASKYWSGYIAEALADEKVDNAVLTERKEGTITCRLVKGRKGGQRFVISGPLAGDSRDQITAYVFAIIEDLNKEIQEIRDCAGYVEVNDYLRP